MKYLITEAQLNSLRVALTCSDIAATNACYDDKDFNKLIDALYDLESIVCTIVNEVETKPLEDTDNEHKR
jgi:hypothetical protein